MSITLERTAFDKRLDAVVDAFEERLRDDSETDVRLFLPAGRADEDQEIALELLRVDLQYRWKRGDAKRVLAYMREFPDLLTQCGRTALAFEEYRMATSFGWEIDKAAFEKTYAISTADWPTWEGDRSDSNQRDAVCQNSLRMVDASDRFPEVGDTIGEFRLERILGRGSFAVVYLARQPGLANRQVVLKVTCSPTSEPDKLARLQHTNIVPIHSLHEFDGFHVICMPYLGQQTLANELQQLDRSQANFVHQQLRMVQQITEGLAHAHDRGILHRDLKPANVLITDEGTAMLMDFNLAEEASPDRQTNVVVGGTLPYMSPEQLRAVQNGCYVDATADLYSVGVMAYQLLAGEMPFPQRTGQFEAIIQQMVQDRQAWSSLDKKHSQIPPSVAAMVDKLISPDRNDRYQHASQLLEDLDLHFADRPLRYAKRTTVPERAAKFARRHPRLTSVSSVAMLSMILLCAMVMTVRTAWRQASRSQARHAVALMDADVPKLLAAFSLPQLNVDDATVRVAAEHLDTFADSERSANPWRWLGENERRLATEDLLDLHYVLGRYHFLQSGQLDAGPQRLAEVNESVRLLTNGIALAKRHQQDASALVSLLHEVQNKPAVNSTALPESESDSSHGVWRDALYSLAQCDFAESISRLERLRDASPHDGAAWLLLGNAYAGVGRWDDAEACYDVCISMWPDSMFGYFQRGLCRMDSNEFDQAWLDFDHCLRIDSHCVAALVNRSAASKELGEWAEAIADLDQAIRLEPERSRYYLLRSELKRRAGNRDGAAVDLQLGLGKTPRDEAGWVQRGFAKLRADETGAAEDFQRALQLNPKSRVARRNLAYLIGERQGRLAEAVKLLQDLVKDFDNMDDQISLAVYEARLGHRDAAVASLNRVRRQSPSDKQWFQMACVYSLLSTGTADLEAAAYCLDQAMAMNGQWSHVSLTDEDLAAVRASEYFGEVQRHAEFRAKWEDRLRQNTTNQDDAE
ncbi:MAG: protein kinase [Pirellulaceae bacterium]